MHTTLLLIRHGQSQGNLTRRFAGHWDVPLTDLGLQQAQRTAEFILNTYSVDAVYCSDLSRAAQTGMAVAEKFNIPAIHDRNLREIHAGQWERHPLSQLEQDFPADYSLWLTDIGNSHPTGGESVAHLAQRIECTLRAIAEENPGKTVAIATHATPIRAMQCILSGQPISHMKNIPWASNASVTELFYEDGRFSLGRFSQDSHLGDLVSALPANV